MTDQKKEVSEGELTSEPPLSAGNQNNLREQWLGEMADDPKLLNERYKNK